MSRVRRRKVAARFVLLLVVGHAASCFSIGTIEGYAPSGEVALYEGPLPPGDPGTPVVSLPAGAQLLVQASRARIDATPGDQITLDLRLLVPEGVSVQMLEPELVLVSRAWPEAKKLPVACIEDWTRSPREVHRPDSPVVGSRETLVYPGFGLSLVAEGPRSQTRIPVVEEFELRLPSIRVDGVVVRPEPIRFRAVERFGVWPAVD